MRIYFIRFIVYKILCSIGIHFRCLWDEQGIECFDCDFKKSRYEMTADLHAGQGG